MITPIPNYPGYFIDEDGNLYSKMAPGKENININGLWYYKHIGTIDKHGYLKYHMGNKYVFAHRLVALTFIPNPNNFPIINHKDRNPLNNNKVLAFLPIPYFHILLKEINNFQ